MLIKNITLSNSVLLTCVDMNCVMKQIDIHYLKVTCVDIKRVVTLGVCCEGDTSVSLQVDQKNYNRNAY